MAPNLVDYLLYEPEDAGILWTRRTRSISRRSPSRAMRASHDFWSDHPQTNRLGSLLTFGHVNGDALGLR
jgi:hypothetical protein